MNIQSSHPKVFCILVAKFCCIHYFKYPTTFVDRLDFLLLLNVDCSLFELLWHRAIEMERTTDDLVVLFQQTIAKNREVISEKQKLLEELKQRDANSPGWGGTLRITGCGCAVRTLEPLAYTRASFSWILLPYTRVNFWFPQSSQPTGQFREKWQPILDPNAQIYIPYA